MAKIHRWRASQFLSPQARERARQKAIDSMATACWIPFQSWQKLDDDLRQEFKWIVELPFRLWREGATYNQPTPYRWVVASDGSEEDLSAWNATVGQPLSLLIRPQDIRKGTKWITNLRPETALNTHFEFLPWRPEYPWRPTVKEIRRMLDVHRSTFPDAPMRTYPGLESWDDRLDPNLEVEPVTRPNWVHHLSVDPKISVIIPTHNNSAFVTNVIQALLNQSLPREDFEILVIDDGGTDDTETRLKEILAPENGRINFSYYFMPRPIARKSGDNHYRAGIARNLGVKRARGEYLQFLDSDILVQPGFLSSMLNNAGTADIIQCERHHIKPEFCKRPVQYSEVEIGTQTFVEEANYWGPFFNTDDWMSIPNFWKYTCTYCLFMKKSDFIEIGGFKRTFTTYGFEDVDIGYEFFKRGKKFRLRHERTLHLTPERSRSEYSHSPWIRQQLLSRTAKTFFRQHLDPQIYDMLGIFMGETAWIARLRARWRKSDRPLRWQSEIEL